MAKLTISKAEERQSFGVNENKDFIIKCANCNKKIAIFKQIYKTEQTYPVRVKCCYCNDESDVTQIPLGAKSAGYHISKQDSEDADAYTILNFDKINEYDIAVFYTTKLKEQ